MRVLLTGSTGFLGSHIAEELIANGYDLLLTKRNQSDLWRCETFIDRAQWINTDFAYWEEKAINYHPDIIINAAWNGVAASNRTEWIVQTENIIFQQKLLNIAKKTSVKKFIGIGSQAEYGEFNGCVNEEFPTQPNSAYGATKLAAMIIVHTFCELNNIKWYWFRLFSCFGEREGENWLIPSSIKKMLTEKSMDLTPGDQQYSYLYVKEVAKVFVAAIESNANNGIYNIASNTQRSLKEILNFIRDYLNPTFLLNYGTLPYRPGQSMINGAIIDKMNEAFKSINLEDFESKLIQTIDYYKNKYNG